MEMLSNAKAILELLKYPGNSNCADCGYENVEWACYNVGIFVCGRCAEVHKRLGAGISQVKHLSLDRWEDSQIQRMTEVGNTVAEEKYQAMLPPAYRVPTHSDPQGLLEEWIVGKYEREEFMSTSHQVFMTGYLEDFLMKRGKEDPKYHPRKFVLDQQDGTIKYYVHESGVAKGVLDLKQTSLSFAPEKMEKAGSMQVSYCKDGSTRHIYLYHDRPEVMVLWYQAIRCSIFHCLRDAFPHATTHELVMELPVDYKEGWLWKTGPKPTDAFRKRWFTLDRRKLLYHTDPLSAWPKGEIILDKDTCRLKLGLPVGTKEKGYCFTLETPNRVYCLSAETENLREYWMSAIHESIRLPRSSLLSDR